MAAIDPVRGEVWLVQFDKTFGEEIRKTRPAIVMNRPRMGRRNTRMVTPITTGRPQFTNLAWMAKVQAESKTGLDHDSFADASQTQPVSLKRFVKQLGVIADSSTLDRVASAIALCVGHASQPRKRKSRRR